MWHFLIRTENETPAFLARIFLGIVMFPHGAQKVFGWFGGSGFSGSMQHLAGTGMPAAIAYLVIAAEFAGSIGLLVGFLSRIAALGIGLVMVGGILMVHGQHGFFMNWLGQQQGEGYEYHLLAIGLSLVIILRGSGRLSLDHSLYKKI